MVTCVAPVKMRAQAGSGFPAAANNGEDHVSLRTVGRPLSVKGKDDARQREDLTCGILRKTFERHRMELQAGLQLNSNSSENCRESPGSLGKVASATIARKWRAAKNCESKCRGTARFPRCCCGRRMRDGCWCWPMEQARA